jgi:hypothetical protein
MDEILEITFRVTDACERLGVPYAVVGSLASSLHGIPRATQDVDIVAYLTVVDLQYLRRVSALLGVEELLEQALRTDLR